MVIGITGGVGAGKSTVIKYIKELTDAEILLTDDIAKDLMKPGKTNYINIVNHFGPEVLNEDKTINNKALAKIVFNSKEQLEILNSLTHPTVINYVKEFILSNPGKMIIVESALLLDTELKNLCDQKWYIKASLENRIHRLKTNRNYSREKINSMINSQRDENYFEANCDIIIINNDLNEMKKSVYHLLQK